MQSYNTKIIDELHIGPPTGNSESASVLIPWDFNIPLGLLETLELHDYQEFVAGMCLLKLITCLIALFDVLTDRGRCDHCIVLDRFIGLCLYNSWSFRVLECRLSGAQIETGSATVSFISAQLYNGLEGLQLRAGGYISPLLASSVSTSNLHTITGNHDAASPPATIARRLCGWAVRRQLLGAGPLPRLAPSD